MCDQCRVLMSQLTAEQIELMNAPSYGASPIQLLLPRIERITTFRGFPIVFDESMPSGKIEPRTDRK